MKMEKLIRIIVVGVVVVGGIVLLNKSYEDNMQDCTKNHSVKYCQNVMGR